MTRHDATDPTETASDGSSYSPGPVMLSLPARDVPLGGVRDMSVQRSLPQREVPTVGAWCFLDRFGPQEVTMRVEPHPHTGLQTVTWPLTGEIRHRDTLGSDVTLRRGALNLMTSGHGIAHSEYSLGDEPVPMDALQLWIALPEDRRHGAPAFETHESLPIARLPAHQGADAEAIVVMGTFAGVESPASTFTPMVGAELHIAAGASVTVPLNPQWEHAVLGIDGDLTIEGEPGPDVNDLLYVGMERTHIEVSSKDGATVFVLGGEPFNDDLVMWWNFVARTHDEIVQAREEWEGHSDRFGVVPGHGDTRIPAPGLPGVRLKPRQRRT